MSGLVRVTPKLEGLNRLEFLHDLSRKLELAEFTFSEVGFHLSERHRGPARNLRKSKRRLSEPHSTVANGIRMWPSSGSHSERQAHIVKGCHRSLPPVFQSNGSAFIATGNVHFHRVNINVQTARRPLAARTNMFYH